MQSAKKLVALLHDGGTVETRFDNAMQKQKNTGIRCFPDVKHMVDGGLFFRCLIWENAEKIKAYPASHHDGPAMRAIKEQDLYVAAKFLESAIYMHHRLYDMCDLKERLTLHEAYESYMETVWTSDGTSFRQMQENFYNNVIDKEECSTLVVQAVIETIKLYRKCGYFARSQKKQCGSPEFYFGMAERMLISSLMDSDWMDAATCADQRFDRVLANAKACTDWEQLDQAFNVKLEDTENKADNIPLNRCRSYISDECCRASDTDYMQFRLGAPTGSGKTMSSLRFALTQAKKQHAKRIFYRMA